MATPQEASRLLTCLIKPGLVPPDALEPFLIDGLEIQPFSRLLADIVNTHNLGVKGIPRELRICDPVIASFATAAEMLGGEMFEDFDTLRALMQQQRRGIGKTPLIRTDL